MLVLPSAAPRHSRAKASLLHRPGRSWDSRLSGKTSAVDSEKVIIFFFLTPLAINILEGRSTKENCFLAESVLFV